jgi:hypothetical protein
MSDLTPKAEAAAKSVDSRNGECGLAKCKCERYEFSKHADGFDTCVCNHTRWSHAVAKLPQKV